MSSKLSLRVAKSFSRQQYLFLFGAPGVGKGTYAQMLAKDLGFNQISTGDELRKILRGQASQGFDKNLIAEIKDIVSKGGLVSDDIVINILKEKIKEPESAQGVILDGFPRTVSQLEKYEKLFPIDVVVNIFLDESVLIEKLAARRTCVGCGKSYNLVDIHRNGYDMYPLLPKVAGKCDKCGDKLITRPDDEESVIKNRMVEYNEKTFPLLDIYRKKGLLFDFEPKKGVQDYPRFLEALKPLLKK